MADSEVEGSAEPAPATEAADSATEADLPDGETFDRAYVEKLRKESGGYRTKLREMEDSFSGFSDDDRTWWFDMANRLGKPQTQEEFDEALQYGYETFKTLAGVEDPASTTEEVKDMDEEADPQYMTKDEYEAAAKKQEEKFTNERRVADYIKRAEALGYEQNTPDFADLMYRAQQLKGDLDKAHEQRGEIKEKVIEEYLAAKAKDKSDSVKLPGASEGREGPESEKSVSSFGDATAAAEAMFAAQDGQPVS